MYQDYYGLDEKPFSLTPDTDFFYQSLTHQEALNVLLVAIQGGDGFIKVVGEVGTGKTLLCRMLLEKLEANFNTIYIPNPYMSCDALLQAVLAEMDLPSDKKQESYLACINQQLINSARKGQTTVIILDESQSLPVESLEAIRLLSNLETEKQKLVQIVLFGQPELDEKLSQRSIRQLRQRIMHSYYLKPLDEKAVEAYLQHRISSAGYCGPELFKPAAKQTLHKISGGVPRLINVLSNKAMMLAYASGDFYIEQKHVVNAAKDSHLNVPGAHKKAGQYLLQLGLLSLLSVSLFLMGQQ